MRKGILSKFIILMGFLFSFALNAGNKENFNNFEKFSARMSNNPDYISYAIISGNGNKYPVQLNVGNYLAFMPSRYAAVNVYEFLSDTLKKDFKIIKINKKGKITNESKIIKYSPNDFFSNYTENTDSEKAEMKSMGMVFAGVKNIFDQYQKDFDKGKDRDADYIYGPQHPRTYFMGLKLSLN